MKSKQAKYSPSNNNRQLPPHKTTYESGRESLKRPLNSPLSREQNEQTPETTTGIILREAKKQKKDTEPIIKSYQSHIKLPPDTTQCSDDKTQDPDSDDLSIAEVLAQLGR